jgi:hypothetical protein
MYFLSWPKATSASRFDAHRDAKVAFGHSLSRKAGTKAPNTTVPHFYKKAL